MSGTAAQRYKGDAAAIREWPPELFHSPDKLRLQLGIQMLGRHAILRKLYNVDSANQCLDVLPGLVDELGVI